MWLLTDIRLMIRPIFCIVLVMLPACLPVRAQAQESGGGQPPPVHLPAPSGPYIVGTRVCHWTDDTREDVWSNGDREIMAQLWYPAADTAGTRRAPYLTELDALRPLLDAEEVAWYQSVTTNAWLDAPIMPTEGGHPVLVFSHGLGSRRAHYSILAEGLASHGFLVAAIDHPFAAEAVAFPDGRVVEQHPLWSQIQPPAHPIEARFRFTDKRTIVWANDARFVLDRLDAMNRSGPFAGGLDLDRVGVYGHSVGGKAAVVACMLDARFDACLNLDGWPMHSHVELYGLDQPFMFIEDIRDVTQEELESWHSSLREYTRNMRDLRLRKERLLDGMKATAYHVTIRGIRHAYFSDLPSLMTEAVDADATLAPAVALETIFSYALAFFEEHVMGEETMLLNPDAVLSIHGSEQYRNPRER